MASYQQVVHVCTALHAEYMHYVICLHLPMLVCSCIRSLCSLWTNFSIIPGTKFAIIWELLIIAVVLIVAWVYSYEVRNATTSINVL